jgi:uncharacterized repeat protein (TIGR01451 family)
LLLFLILLPAPVSAQVITMTGTDISVSKTASAPSTTGEPITYTVTVQVPPPGSNGFVITDTLPGGFLFAVVSADPRLDLSPMTIQVPPGSTGTLVGVFGGVITMTVVDTFEFLIRAVPLVTNTFLLTEQSVTVTGSDPDPDPTNNSATVRVRIGDGSTAIPTLGEWALLLLALLMVASALSRLRTSAPRT